MKKSTFLIAVLTAISFSGNAQNNGNGNGNGNALPNNGNVGVGTTNPTAQLHVNGKMKVDSTVTMSDTLFVESTAQVTESFRVEGATEMQDVIIYGTTWMQGLQELDTNDFGILVAKEDGTVMKTGPGSLFPVPNEPTDFCELQGNSYNTNPYWVSQPNKLYTACPDVFVGVNTDNPRVNLDVIGNTFSQRLYMGLAEPTQISSDIYFQLNVPFTNADDKTVFKVENNDRQLFSINSTGLVRSREIKIDAQAWADFVFKPNYELPTLSDVETYIQENGHLPNIPSEEEILEEGINVAEMNALLLQKIEELTLYNIELEKRINALESQIQQKQ